MKIINRIFILFLILQLAHFVSGGERSELPTDSILFMETIIENFDDGQIALESYPVEDHDPDSWELNSGITWQNSPFSLKLFGNTWKVENIDPMPLDSGDVWQISAYIDSEAEIQGFGIMDEENVLFYSFAGTQTLSSDQWIAVYQGAFEEDQWNIYQLPVADDWLSVYGYLPQISALVFLNDRDDTNQGVIYFDEILDITDDLPVAPTVSVDYSILNFKNEHGKMRSVEFQFNSNVIDPDSQDHNYFWDFGDGTGSSLPNPTHIFEINDDHPYTVLLKVVDPDEMWGWASCRVEPEPGNSTLPVTLNFVGDIMLAREYEYPGGIISTQGVEAIFDPTLPYLGEAADITVANLECTFTTAWQHHPTKEIYYKASPQNVDGLTYAGIDVVSIANNHIMDYLKPGMEQTRSVLAQHEIVFSGAGENSYQAYLPAFYTKKGINFAFLAACDRTGQYTNSQPYLNAGFNKSGFANLQQFYMKMQIDAVKDVSDFVVMEFHAGSEYSFYPENDAKNPQRFMDDSPLDEDYFPLSAFPSDDDIEIRHFAIDNGADLVICHHPHILHGVELYNGKLVAHSLGNFAFDLAYPETFPSAILNTEADEKGFTGFSLTPVYIDDFIPKRAEGELGLHILNDLAWRSKLLKTYLKVDRENIVATVIMDTLNMQLFETEYFVTAEMNPENSSWITRPVLLENGGRISAVYDIQPPESYEFRLGRDEIWFGNMEDEGCTLWNLNSADETYCDTVAYSGQRSIQLRRESGAPYNIVTNFEQRIICLSDTLSFTLAGFIKTLNGKGVTIQIQYFADRENPVALGEENLGTTISGTKPWTFYYHNLTIPAGTEFFDVRLNSNVPNSGTSFAWFDNVSLICWDEWQPFTESQAIISPNDYYFLQVKSDNYHGEIGLSYVETEFDENVVGVNSPPDIPEKPLLLFQNSPNPFIPGSTVTEIAFILSETDRVQLSVFDLKGQLIRILADDIFNAGKNICLWDGKNAGGRVVDTGIYFLELKTTDQRLTGKCVVIR